MKFNNPSYRTLFLSHKSGRILGQLTLHHLDHARAHVHMNTNTESDQFHLVCSGKDAISLKPEPQGVLVALVRRGGSRALEGHCLIEMWPHVSTFTVCEHVSLDGE